MYVGLTYTPDFKNQEMIIILCQYHIHSARVCNSTAYTLYGYYRVFNA